MSLINDALKRAKVEALRQEADRQGVDYQAVPAYSRAQPSKSNFLLVGWIVAGIAVALVLVMFLRTLPQSTPAAGPSAAKPVGRSETTESASREVALMDEIGVDASSDPLPGEGAAPSAVAPIASESAESPVATTPTGEPVAILSEPTAEGKGRDLPSEAPAPERTLRSTTQVNAPLVEGMTYLRRARAADGSTVELGGIAYSDDRPIAVINGSVVSAGDMIQGFTVISVEPERVELETGGARIYLALH